MEDKFKTISPEEITENPFKLIGKDWMLIAAGTHNDFNMMTASWGTMGILWNKPIAVIFVRHHRYTFEFIEKQNEFTLNFFSPEYRDILHLCGTTSGREVDKLKETGLSPLMITESSIGFEQAKLIMTCKKIYFDDLIAENFLEKEIANLYPNKDYHRIYIGEIKQCFQKK